MKGLLLWSAAWAAYGWLQGTSPLGMAIVGFVIGLPFWLIGVALSVFDQACTEVEERFDQWTARIGRDR
jgi:hypothetical protein